MTLQRRFQQGWRGQRGRGDRRLPRSRRPDPTTSLGLTFLETLIVLVLVGILTAIAVPSWQGFLLRHHLNASQDQAQQVIRRAQQEAVLHRETWQVSFRQNGDRVEWAVHDRDTVPTLAAWSLLSTQVRIHPTETTLLRSAGIYRVRFTHQGRVSGQLGRLTFAGQRQDAPLRCVFVSTLLGAMREAHNRPTPDSSGRYCY